MIETQKLSLEKILFALAFGIALAVRLMNLNAYPLSDFEAAWALQAWQAAQGLPIEIGPNPAYFSLTSLTFFSAESSNFLARFWPALAGALLVLVPAGFKWWIGREAALILAFGLALDPGLIAVSRVAGGPMLAIAFLLAAGMFWLRQKRAAAAVFGGLALISGPGVLTGILGLGIAVGLSRLTGISFGWLQFVEPETSQTESELPFAPWVLLGSVLILGSTLFFRHPSGLSAWASTLPTYLNGWVMFSGVPVFEGMLALVVYQPLALVFGLVFSARAWVGTHPMARFFSIWLGVALILTMIYPSRQVFDAAWALIPLWVLAALELRRFLRVTEPAWVGLSLAGVIFILLTLLWLMLFNLAAHTLTWLVIVIIPALMILLVIFVGLGWNKASARSGLVWGLTFSLGVYMFSNLFGVTHRLPNDPRSLWFPGAGVGQVDWLVDTLQELGLAQNGRSDWLEIVAVVDAPSLRWALRNFETVRYDRMLENDTLAAVIVTDTGHDLSQTKAYLGQDFVWRVQPGWGGALPWPLPDWLTTRMAPVRVENLILWAREDLFPAGFVQPEAGNDTPVDADTASEPDGTIK